MSTRFTIICDTCDEVGPHIRRHHSGAILQGKGEARFFSIPDEQAAQNDWGSFLIKHEYHELRFATEWRDRPPAVEEERPFTHELMPDGSLREL